MRRKKTAYTHTDAKVSPHIHEIFYYHPSKKCYFLDRNAVYHINCCCCSYYKFRLKCLANLFDWGKESLRKGSRTKTTTTTTRIIWYRWTTTKCSRPINNKKTNKINPKKKMKKSKFSLTDNFLSIDGIGLGKIAIIPARCCQINADRIFVTVFHVPHFVGHFVIFPCVPSLYLLD